MAADFDITANYPNPFTSVTLAQALTSSTTGAVNVTAGSGFSLASMPQNGYGVFNAGGSTREVFRWSTVNAGGGTITIAARGLDGTTAQAHNSGETITCAPLGLYYKVMIDATTGVHGIAGAVVGTTDTQTLTNKQLTSPQIGGSSGGISTNNGRCRASMTADQTGVVSGVLTIINLNLDNVTPNIDPGSNFNTSTYRYVVPVTGDYLIIGKMGVKGATIVANKRYDVIVRRNGSVNVAAASSHASVADFMSAQCLAIDNLTAGDYLQLACYQVSGVNQTITGNSEETYLIVVPL